MSDDLVDLAATLNGIADDLEVLLDLRAERRRAERIAVGLPPEPPERSIDEIRAETIALRARNDQADAERQGRWRTID